MIIKDLRINGLNVERDIELFNYPTPEHNFWIFLTKEKTYICATGNILFEWVDPNENR